MNEGTLISFLLLVIFILGAIHKRRRNIFGVEGGSQIRMLQNIRRYYKLGKSGSKFRRLLWMAPCSCYWHTIFDIRWKAQKMNWLVTCLYSVFSWTKLSENLTVRSFLKKCCFFLLNSSVFESYLLDRISPHCAPSLKQKVLVIGWIITKTFYPNIHYKVLYLTARISEAVTKCIFHVRLKDRNVCLQGKRTSSGSIKRLFLTFIQLGPFFC